MWVDTLNRDNLWYPSLSFQLHFNLVYKVTPFFGAIFLGKNVLEKLIFYLRIFFQVHYGCMKKNLSGTFLMPVFDLCISRGRFFEPIFRL